MAAKPRPAAAPKLPPVTVARLQAAAAQIDGIIVDKANLFAERGGLYVAAFREHSERDLNPDEIAQLAGALGASLGRDDLPELLREVQDSGIRTRNDPPRGEVLLAAGLATAPAFVDACLSFVALIELPADEFEVAFDDGTILLALAEPIKQLRRLGLSEANVRARAAFAHLASEAGQTPGEAVSLILRALGTALQTGIGPLSQYGSVIGSLTPTGGGGTSASTSSDGGMQGI